MKITKYLIAAAVVFVIWTIRLELDPGMGNTWWRIGPDGKKHFAPNAIFRFAVSPLTDSAWWTHKSLISMNLWVNLIVVLGIMFAIDKFLTIPRVRKFFKLK